MELGAIDHLQEAFDKALAEVMDACVAHGRKKSKDCEIKGAVIIKINIVGAEGGCAAIDAFSVQSKLPERHREFYPASNDTPKKSQPPAQSHAEGQMALVPVGDEDVVDAIWLNRTEHVEAEG